jgi:hypothetical protein
VCFLLTKTYMEVGNWEVGFWVASHPSKVSVNIKPARLYINRQICSRRCACKENICLTLFAQK